jgi:hypothetical protein
MKMQELQWCMSQGYTNQQAAEHLGINERTVRRWKSRMAGEPTQEAANQDQADTYVITSAVNATKAHNGFLASLHTYCQANNAKLIVLPMRYRNPTRKEETPDDWWDARLTPHIVSERTKLCRDVVLLADIKIQPTAVNPLQGWLTVSGSDSAILGHTKVALQSVPTKVGDPAKLVMTTGACTVPSYSDTNAGAKGHYHHCLGAVVVEIDGKHSHIRHILGAHDGSFIDLDMEYTRYGVSEAARASVLTMGDIHAYQVDQKALVATEKLAARISPVAICAHDVLDFSSASHHAGYFERYRLHSNGRNSVLKELEVTAGVLERIAGWADETIMIGSNHHQHMEQWLAKHENALDLENALVFHETKSAMLRAIHEGSYLDPFQHWMDQLMREPQRLKWLKPGEHFIRHKIDFSSHGHKGPNGARGSTKAFANIGAKTVTGHSHSPAIIDGAYTVGTTSKLKLGYNLDSPSSWHHSHCITYANGKRTLIHCVNGRFFR